MTMFMTKVWGYGSPSGPLQFGSEGWRTNALRKLVVGDLVALVGTLGEPTPPDMRGRVLAVVEPTHTPVMSLDYDLPTRPSDRNDEGGYKWPYALVNREAWSLPDRPKLSDISSRDFEMDSVRGIVQLTAEEEARIRSFAWSASPLRPMTAAAQERFDREHGISNRYSPPPATTRRVGVMHLRNARAYTYAMRIEGSPKPAFKIGWAFDYVSRARQFNHASLPDLSGLRYVPELDHLWDTARQAYRMEQRLLKAFASRRPLCNHEVVVGVRESDLASAWARCLSDAR